jgi:hypothetical protein
MVDLDEVSIAEVWFLHHLIILPGGASQGCHVTTHHVHGSPMTALPGGVFGGTKSTCPIDKGTFLIFPSAGSL